MTKTITMNATTLQKALAKIIKAATVGGRGFDAIATPVESIPDDMIARAFEYGWQQGNADSASGAARDAVPSKITDGLEGDARKAAEDEWMAVETNGPTIIAERVAQIKASIARKLEGDWKVKTATGVTFTPLQAALYNVATKIKGNSGWSDMATVFVGLKGTPTRERVETVLAFVESLDAKRKAAISSAAAVQVESMAALSGLDF